MPKSDVLRVNDGLFKRARSAFALGLSAITLAACSSIYVPPPRADGAVDPDGGNDAMMPIDMMRPDFGPNYDGGPDLGLPPVDMGVPPTDMGTPPADMGTSPIDMGTTPVDMGTGPVDMGTPLMDMGTTPVDMGTSPIDMGTTPVDMGTDSGPPSGFCSMRNAGTVAGGGDLNMGSCSAGTAFGASTAAPRLLRPLHSSAVTTQQPRFRWRSPTGGGAVILEIATTRSNLEAGTFEYRVQLSSGTSHAPDCPLTPGAHFWRVRTSDLSQSSAIWEVLIPGRSATVDTSFGNSLRDIDGDGYSDVVVGSKEDGVSIFFGPDTTSDETWIARPAALTGGYHFGGSVALSDVNGDSFADVIVGAEQSAGGRVLVYYGPHPESSSPTQIMAPSTFTMDTYRYFGSFVMPAGDVNGDGYGDIVVCSYRDAYIFHGSSAGISTTPARSLLLAIDTGYDRHPVVGDFDGNGFSDVGFPNNNQIVVFYGSSAGTGIATGGTTLIDDRGYPSGGTDINSDGYADIVSVYGYVNVYLGGSPKISTVEASSSLLGGAEGSTYGGFGLQSSAVGDLNGDGYPELVIANREWGSGANDNDGRAYIYSSTGCAFASSYLTLPNPVPTAHDQFGMDVGVGGDISGDGRADFLMGTTSGTVYQFHGANGDSTHLINTTPYELGHSGTVIYWGRYVCSP